MRVRRVSGNRVRFPKKYRECTFRYFGVPAGHLVRECPGRGRRTVPSPASRLGGPSGVRGSERRPSGGRGGRYRRLISGGWRGAWVYSSSHEYLFTWETVTSSIRAGAYCCLHGIRHFDSRVKCLSLCGPHLQPRSLRSDDSHSCASLAAGRGSFPGRFPYEYPNPTPRAQKILLCRL